MDDQPKIAPKTQQREIVGIDLLRFAAAFMVMSFHLGFWGCASPQSRTNSLLQVHACFPALAPWASAGWVGVEIFFVISGFVIAWSAQNASALSFVRRRFLRLAPAAWICATLTLFAALACTGTAHELARAYMRTLVFYPTAPWVDDAYWTLDVEIAFYAIVAAVLAFGRRAWITPVIAGVGAASASFWILRAAVGAAGLSSLSTLFDRAAQSRYSELALIQHGCFFCIGAIFCAGMGARLPRAFLAVALYCGVGGALEIAASAAHKSELTGYVQSIPASIAIWLLAVGAIAASIRFSEAASRPSWLAWARRIGLMTYPLYLLHSVIGSITMQTLIRSGSSDSEALALAIALLVALAFLVSEFLEPAGRWALANLLAAWSARSGAAAKRHVADQHPAIKLGDRA